MHPPPTPQGLQAHAPPARLPGRQDQDLHHRHHRPQRAVRGGDDIDAGLRAQGQEHPQQAGGALGVVVGWVGCLVGRLVGWGWFGFGGGRVGAVGRAEGGGGGEERDSFCAGKERCLIDKPQTPSHNFTHIR